MSSRTDFLNITEHRPWPIPEGDWEYYQEWNDALFLHFEVDEKDIAALLPEGLQPDQFDGKYYVSIVCFRMERIRPRLLPQLWFLSNFYEINVRTYINNGGITGVFFLNIEAEKQISIFVAKLLSGLPYEKSKILKTANRYRNQNPAKGFSLDCTYAADEIMTDKTPFERWITERYSLYLLRSDGLYRYQLHHREWNLCHAKIPKCSVNYSFGNISLNENNLAAAYYSDGVRVVSWKAEKLHLKK